MTMGFPVVGLVAVVTMAAGAIPVEEVEILELEEREEEAEVIVGEIQAVEIVGVEEEQLILVIE